jgi:hypothetical protein
MTLPNQVNPLVQASSAAPYTVNNSVRFRSSASAYLSRTPASAGNQQKWTWSGWVKRGALANNLSLFSAGTTSPTYDGFRFDSSDRLQFFQGGAAVSNLVTTSVYRDPSSWYHIILAVDTTQATASNRVKIYVNSNQITSFSTSTYPTQNTAASINNNLLHVVSAQTDTAVVSLYFDGYLAEVNFIDGQALTPSSFGAYSANGVWQPARYTGTYGTNGFYLKFASFGTAAALGTDSSGNGNTWTVNNISVTAGTTYDPMLDSPTLTSATVANYCVINAVDKNGTIINGNLTATTTSSYSNARATFGVSSGKWYWEQTIDQVTSNNAGLCQVNGGVALSTYSLTVGSGSAGMWGFQNSNGAGTASWKYDNGTGTNSYTVFTTGDIAGFALDMGAGTLAVYRNNTLLFTCSSSLSGNTVYPCVVSYASGQTATSSLNFGQRAFSYTPPTGFVALNAYNLPTPTIANGATVMAATTWTGDGTTPRTFTNGGNNTLGVTFKPDLVWAKPRSAATNNVLYDSVRGSGSGKALSSNLTDAEGLVASGNSDALYGYLSAFNNNGFSATTGSSGFQYFNTNTTTEVAWQWLAGAGSSSSNTNGSITSTVSVNATAGFSVVTYTGTGANATVGHGLGVAPVMIIIKSRVAITGSADWIVGNQYCYSTTAWVDNYALTLNLSNGKFGTEFLFGNPSGTAPTSTVFSVGTSTQTNKSATTYVAYCWSAVAGYSAFGSYTGNGSTDGPFVYTGFRPRFVMMKRTDANGYSWCIVDTSRVTYNVDDLVLRPDTSGTDVTGNTTMDVLSNGFKVRTTWTDVNASGGTYIYAAFAENPFKYALAR